MRRRATERHPALAPALAPRRAGEEHASAPPPPPPPKTILRLTEHLEKGADGAAEGEAKPAADAEMKEAATEGEARVGGEWGGRGKTAPRRQPVGPAPVRAGVRPAPIQGLRG